MNCQYQSMRRYDFFLSYQSDDASWTGDLARHLRDAGLEVFFAPTALRAGSRLASELHSAIRSSRVAAVVISKRTATSGWVELEVGLMIDLLVHRELRSIVPLFRDPGARPPPFLETLLGVRLSAGASPAEAASLLIDWNNSAPKSPEGMELAVEIEPRVNTEKKAPRKLRRVDVTIGNAEILFLTLPAASDGTRIALAATPLTQGQLARIAGETSASNLPLTGVTPSEAVELCVDLAHRCARRIRLPTATEWSRAYSAGTTTRFFTGVGEDGMRGYAHFGAAAPAPVAHHSANPWGFYDLAGGVWEICRQPNWTRFVVAKGGSWASAARQCTATYWIPLQVDDRSDQVGLRLALELERSEWEPMETTG